MIAKFARIFVLAAIAATLSGSLLAQSDQGLDSRLFGQGQPATVNDLPPGQLKRDIESLPPQAAAKAIKWLQDFSFHSNDLNSIRVDVTGGILYADHLKVEQSAAQSAEQSAPEAAPQSVLDDAFLLHSRPGAPNTVFLDFDGDSFTDTAWGTGTFNAKAFDIDGSPTTFNNTERSRIVDIWHRVAEDLAMFDIDVTTEEPASFGPYTGHVLITHTLQVDGSAMPYNSGGGVAYVGVFGRSDYHTRYSPALVYFNQLGNGDTYTAEASSHEFGHNLGLGHDGTSTVEYYRGLGSDSSYVSWAPIMGNSYYKNITEWSIGEYPGANNTQDDLAIIENNLGIVPDDHGDDIAGASALFVDADGSVVASNPEFDPHNVLPENKGIINDSADVDVFAFLTGPGAVDLTIKPAWDAFPRSTRRGANLDVSAELRDSGGALVVASDPGSDTMATISATVDSGAYYLLITGVGNTSTPYSDYNSMGEYFIEGTVQPTASDKNAPNPDPMGFEVAPIATGPDTITMTALEATDDVSAVQYEFRCQFGGNGCVASTIQSSRVYTATGLDPETKYSFSVLAMDQSDNMTAASSWLDATTEALPDWVDYFSESDTPVAGSVSGAHTLTHEDDFYAQSFTERESGGKPANRHAYMEHLWNFNLPAGAMTEVHMTAYKSTDNPDEIFRIEYSANGGPWSFLMDIASTSNTNQQSALIPDAPSGSVILRVVDTHQQSGDRVKSRFHVDHMFIRVGSPPTDPPVAPSGLMATAMSSSQIDLAWTDNADTESGYTVERSADGSAPWDGIAELPAGAQSYSDTGLSASTLYYYRVLAWNANGGTASNVVSATTDAPPSIPQAPTGLTATMVSASEIGLAWVDNASNEDGFRVERSPTGLAESWSLVTTLGPDATNYQDSGLQEATTYYYQVVAFNVSGGAASNTDSETTDSAPALSLEASGYKTKGKHGVVLTWTGASSVDIYFQGGSEPLFRGVGGNNYDHMIGNKGGATYTHKVCETGTSNCSNTTTTVF